MSDIVRRFEAPPAPLPVGSEAARTRSRWSPALVIGVEEIDGQHEELFARTAAFVDAVGAARTDRLLDLLSHLGGYVVSHFESEEALMKSVGYPRLADHLAEHESFRETFGRLVNHFARYGDDARIVVDVESVVTEWLVRHVSHSDMAFGAFLRARGG